MSISNTQTARHSQHASRASLTTQPKDQHSRSEKKQQAQHNPDTKTNSNQQRRQMTTTSNSVHLSCMLCQRYQPDAQRTPVREAACVTRRKLQTPGTAEKQTKDRKRCVSCALMWHGGQCSDSCTGVALELRTSERWKPQSGRASRHTLTNAHAMQCNHVARVRMVCSALAAVHPAVLGA